MPDLPSVAQFGMVAAAAVALITTLGWWKPTTRPAVKAITYSGVTALIPGFAYSVLSGADGSTLMWLGIFLGALLGALGVSTRDDKMAWRVCLGLRGLWLWVVVLLLSFAGYSLLLHNDKLDWYWALAIGLGTLVGASEIISRYRDEPGAALLCLHGLIYLIINGIISGAAYKLLRHYSDSLIPAIKNDHLLTAIVAGFGAMIVMRSKLFSFRSSSGEEFAVGPDAVISIFLKSVDRAIDRWRSVSRQRLVFQLTQGIEYSPRVPSFFKASIAAYQNLTDSEKTELKEIIEGVESGQIEDQLKFVAMAFGFLNISGEANFSELMGNLVTFLKTQPPDTGEAEEGDPNQGEPNPPEPQEPDAPPGGGV
ncbi:hypothetical protein R5W24_003845 [Gemmata sp. JC717]|uniref:hypothetical protein n=1 Tax=Gemmata algarum TaxID=2975278 RepID=UPI0021BB678C|nr:hypothetical protein [Gemmata algarum]MDY3554716.1 hypothetical protein [Gemmata algarum]